LEETRVHFRLINLEHREPVQSTMHRQLNPTIRSSVVISDCLSAIRMCCLCNTETQDHSCVEEAGIPSRGLADER
jgi:hypothetical protein